MTSEVEVKTPNGKVAVYYQYEGFTISKNFVKHDFPAKDLALQMKWIKETEVRSDDVIICAFPKTGTHWVWEIINMLLQGTPEYVKEAKEVAMLEFNTKEMTSSLTSPRVLNTHLTHNLLPVGIKEKGCKIVHVMRNPKDVFISLYFHMKAEQPDLPPMDWYSKSFRGKVGVPDFCSYLWYVKHFEQFQKDNPEYPLLNMFYEDLKKNPIQEITKLAAFLEKDLSKDTICAIADKCQFASLKQVNDEWKNDPVKKLSKDGTSFIYRKGQIGDWKNYLTVRENEEFDKWIEEGMKGSDMKFQFE